MRKWTTAVAAMMSMALMVSLAARAQDAAVEPATGQATVKGVVTGEDGKPVAKVQVSLRQVPAGSGSDAPDRMQADGERKREGKKDGKANKGVGKPVAQTTTGEDGSFTLQAPAGSYMLVAMGKGQGNARQEVTLTAGQTQEVALTLMKGKAKKDKENEAQ